MLWRDDKAQAQGGVLLPCQFLQSSHYEHHVNRRALGSDPPLFLQQNVLEFAIAAQAILCCCCCRCYCSHINLHNHVRGHRTGSSHSGAEEYPRENHKQSQRWYTHSSQLTQSIPPTETCKRQIGSQPKMFHVHTGAYVLLLAPGKTNFSSPTIPLATLERLPRTRDRRKSTGKKKGNRQNRVHPGGF